MMGQRTDIVIARTIGIVCIAGGFIIGMHGLDHPQSFLMPVALGLVATGLLAQIYALVRWSVSAVKGQQPTERKNNNPT